MSPAQTYRDDDDSGEEVTRDDDGDNLKEAPLPDVEDDDNHQKVAPYGA